ncbi:MAG TPA: hypothetical protein VFX15_13705 [Actinomycetes bacterium]|nr:hypothetical protein [Actinomycetes bacterium]
MVEFREDFLVYPSMIRLAACLCTEIEASGLPTPCSCGVVPGPIAVLESCSSCADGKCGGQAWVRLMDAVQSKDFPAPDAELSTCASPLMWTLEVGIARCAPMGTNSPVRGFTPPTIDAYLAAVRLQMADMAAMRRAIACCFADGTNSYLLGGYAPLTVEGGCEGGVWTVQVWEVGD